MFLGRSTRAVEVNIDKARLLVGLPVRLKRFISHCRQMPKMVKILEKIHPTMVAADFEEVRPMDYFGFVMGASIRLIRSIWKILTMGNFP